MNEGTGSALFTLDSVDLSSIISTVTTNAPIVIGAAVTFILVKKAIPLVPQMVSRLIR